jgi:hypothetical protein
MGLMGLTGALGGFLCGYASGIGFYAGLALVWCAVLHAVMAAEEWARPTRRDAAVRVLTRMEDVRAVGALAEALEYRPARPGVQRALTRLLPAMTAQDVSLLTEYQRQCLRRALERGVPHEEGDFLVAVLNLLERIGDTPAIPSVEMLLRSASGHAVSDADLLLRPESPDGSIPSKEE